MSTCKRTGLPTSKCECWEIKPLTKPLTVEQHKHYRDRADAQEREEWAEDSKRI